MDDRVGERVAPVLRRSAWARPWRERAARSTERAVVGTMLAAFLLGCAPDISPNDPTPGSRAIFDPTSAVLPLPNGLLQDLDEGRLDLPVDSAVDSPLTREIKQTLNDLDGWLTGSAITIPFDAPLDGASLADGGILLVDLGSTGGPIAPAAIDPASFHAATNASFPMTDAAPYPAVVKLRAPGPFEPAAELGPGRRYAAVVTDAARGADGLPVVGHPVFEFLKSTTPLLDAAGHSLTILPDADAASLEPARSALVAPAFDAMEAAQIVTREQAIAFTVFSTQSGARPLFVPLPVGQLLPTPMDVEGSANAALDASVEVLLDRPYDPASASAAMRLYEAGAVLRPVAAAVETTTTADADGRVPLRLVPDEPLAPATRYVALVTNELRTLGAPDTAAAGVAAQPGSYFTLVRARSELLDGATSPPTLRSPYLDLTLDVLILLGFDPASASQADWESAHHLLLENIASLEALRASYAPLFEAVEALGLGRERIVVLWAFTTAAA